MLLITVSVVATSLHLLLRRLQCQLKLCKRQVDEAQFDPLTGLYNRREAHSQISQAVLLARRNSEMFGVIFVDLNRFKQINDSYGHRVGDDVLIEIAHRLKGVIRESDELFRLSGDEFLCLTRFTKSRSDCVEVVQKLSHALSPVIAIGDLTLKVTASYGCSLFPLDGESVEVLVDAADHRMYSDKLRDKECDYMECETAIC